MNPSQKSIIKTLRSIELDEHRLNEVQKIISMDLNLVNRLSEHLKGLGFIDHFDLAKRIVTHEDRSDVISLIDNRIYESMLPKQEKFNLVEFLHKKGISLSKKTLKSILMLKCRSSGLVGYGEFLMRLLMKGTGSPLKGDMKVSTDIFEVKCSIGKHSRSRLRGMTGYPTDAYCVSLELDKLFKQSLEHMGFDISNLIDGHASKWNFVSGKRAKPYLLNEIFKLSIMSSVDVLTNFINSLSKYFISMNSQDRLELLYALMPEVSKGEINGKKGYSTFIYILCAYSMRYYMRTEGFDGMIVLNDDLNCVYVTSDFLETNDLSTIAKFIENTFIISPPNLSVKAGPQGSAFGISIK